MRNVLFIMIVLLAVGIMGCKNKHDLPSGILSKEKVETIWWDILQADVYTSLYIVKDSSKKPAIENAKLQQQVFALHKVSREDFYKSLDYYKEHTEQMSAILDSITSKAAKERIKKPFEKKPLYLQNKVMKKLYDNAEAAIADINEGATLMLGGFGLCGIPENCIAALVKKNVKGLTCISNNAGVDDFGIGLMLKQKQVKKMIASYVGENAEFERQLLSGELEVELIPQGTLATRCMAAGYGMPAIFTPAGVGTEIATGKEQREFNNKSYLLEYAFDADFAIVKAWKGDTDGNLIYKETARNFNPLMAMAGKITIAEVEELVAPGELDPNYIHTPGIFVHRIFKGTGYEKRIEQRTTRKLTE